MSDTQDQDQPIAVLAAMMVVSLMVVGLLLGLVLRATAVPLPAPATLASDDPALLITDPLQGELTGTVYFDVDKAALDAHAQAELASVARVLLAKPQQSVVLSGFHDASGDTQRNAQLALQRAKVVRTALVQAGIDLRRVGLRKPAATLAGEPAPLARRVEIRVVD